MEEPVNLEDYERDFGSRYDADSDAWFANLLFWRPSKLSDEHMQLHFSEYDGRWSAQTQQALQRFEARGLDLNENWALSAPYWSCPACGRSKDSIFRLSKRGILLGKLELHHDHLRDLIWARARELFGVDWLEMISKSSIILVDHIRELTSRFDLCLICSECNSADGKVKKRFGSEIDSRFTFTAQEISAFVQAQTGQDHEIDYDRAYGIWEAEKNKFFARISLIDELLAHLINDRLARDHFGVVDARRVGSAFSPQSLLGQSFSRETKHTEAAGLLWRARDEFLARSTQRDSAKLPLADRRGNHATPPTENEYAAYIDPVSSKRWIALADGWCCPVCERGKRQIIRKSKVGKWTGGVRSHGECVLETDTRAMANRQRLFPDFRNDIVVGRVSFVDICSDCANIAPALTQRDQSIREPYLGVEDRRACVVRSQANGQHELDFNIASTRAMVNESYGPALEAFYVYREKVCSFAGRFDRERKCGASEQAVLRELAEDIQVFHRIDNGLECMTLVKWLLAQRQMFEEDFGEQA